MRLVSYRFSIPQLIGVPGQIRTDGFTDLQSVALNHSATDTLVLFNTLFRMCVLKSTVCDIAVQISSMLFNTLPFYAF